jgi:5,6-dimethylbenzimidazole synthase
MHALVETERQATARALGERQDDFMRLKVEGLLDAGEVVVVALADGREAHLRRTLPEMDLASVACAIQNMWLARRIGWASIFDPSSSRACWACRRRPPGGDPVHRPRGGLLPAAHARDGTVGRAHAHRQRDGRKRLADGRLKAPLFRAGGRPGNRYNAASFPQHESFPPCGSRISRSTASP